MYCAGYIFGINNNEAYLQSERDTEHDIPEGEMIQYEKSECSNQNDEHYDNYLKKKQNKQNSIKNFFKRKLSFEFEFVFNTLDMNKDNIISVDELTKKLKEVKCEDPIINNVPEIVKAISIDNNVELNRNDLKNLIKRK